MKGCSKTATKSRRRSQSLKGGSSNDPIPAFSWKQMQQQGGSCNPMKGGSFYQPAGPIPGPFVGQAWSPSVAGWPGVNGIGGDSNYLANNLYKGPDVQTMMQLGGKRMKNKSMNKKKRKGLRGGGLMPQDLVNLGRDVSFIFKSAYNALSGYPAPMNSLPYKDQLSGSMSANRIIV